MASFLSIFGLIQAVFCYRPEGLNSLYFGHNFAIIILGFNTKSVCMKKVIYLIIIVILVLAGVFFFATRLKAPSSAPEDENGDISGSATTTVEMNAARPWIEVLENSAQVKNGETWEELNTGDELENGAVVKTNDTGLAEIHMPDGSVIRLDSASQISLDIADYDENSDTLQVKIKLTAGRVWSKIIELATADSFWEVETTNAVAAVRGTSFGMEYADDETQVIGLENTVEVEAVDATTSERFGRAKITSDTILKIRRDAVDRVRANREALSAEVGVLPQSIKDKPWVARAIKADEVIKKRVGELKERGLDNAQIKKMMRRELMERRIQKLIQLRLQGIAPRLAPLVQPVITPIATSTIKLLNK
jgi:FecR protein